MYNVYVYSVWHIYIINYYRLLQIKLEVEVEVAAPVHNMNMMIIHDDGE